MTARVAFETKLVGRNPRTGVDQVMPGLVTPLDEIPSGFEEVIIDGKPLGISPVFSERFSKAASIAVEAAEEGAIMDCVAFGMVMCGGTFTPVAPKSGRRFVATDQVIRFGAFEEIGGKDITKPLRPAALGVPYRRPGSNQTLYQPLHTIVKIDDDSSLFVQKVGSGDIAIADLQVSNAAFAAPTVGTITQLEFTTPDGEHVMKYGEPGWMLQKPAWIFNSSADDPLNQ